MCVQTWPEASPIEVLDSQTFSIAAWGRRAPTACSTGVDHDQALQTGIAQLACWGLLPSRGHRGHLGGCST
eukprot:2385490-Prymnesium_polylepis.2